jgi:hypothetical protein
MAFDLATVFVSLAGSGVVVWGAARWLGEKSIDHLLERRIEAFKSALERETGDVAAEREYRFEARKRLAAVIGPLRFQLIQAAILYRDRVTNFVRFEYVPRLDNYFGRSTLYRLARLIAVLELIERQMTHLDFSVDPAMLELMQLRGTIFDALCDSSVLLGHPGVNWNRQEQHLFRDEVTVIGTAMMTQPQGEAIRVVRVDEFAALLGDGSLGYLEPLAGQINRLDPTTTPVLWLRLMAVACRCDALVAAEPVAAALSSGQFAVAPLVDASRDPFIAANRSAYLALMEGLRRVDGAMPAGDTTMVIPRP